MNVTAKIPGRIFLMADIFMLDISKNPNMPTATQINWRFTK